MSRVWGTDRTILAEIGDKMASPWLVLLISVPLAALGTSLGRVSRWLLIPVLILPAVSSRMLWQEYVQGSFGQVVIDEMGCCWIGASLAAWNGPFLLGSVLVLWAHRRSLRKNREARNQCLDCGYDHTGKVSGVCPERGERI